VAALSADDPELLELEWSIVLGGTAYVFIALVSFTG
jgi:hypothetical protein